MLFLQLIKIVTWLFPMTLTPFKLSLHFLDSPFLGIKHNVAVIGVLFKELLETIKPPKIDCPYDWTRKFLRVNLR